MTKDQVTLKDVEAASKRLAGVVHKTPLESSHIFSEMAGYEVLLKLEICSVQDRLKYVELQIVFRP